MRLNPFLRPLARMNLPRELCEELDRWTVAWATDKIQFFMNEWFDPTKRAASMVYIEHAWPLFAIAIWLARGGVAGGDALCSAIRRAWAIGWWPRDFDLDALFDDASLADVDQERSEFDRLWERAVNVQLQGDFEEARNLLFLAIEVVGGEDGGAAYYTAHYRLGTLSLDLNDLDGAGRHSAVAERGAAHDFLPPDTLAHLYYEQGLLARRRGREERARERFKTSIDQAQRRELYNLLCLNFQELNDQELRELPVMILDGSPGASVVPDWDAHMAQAELYFRAARDAAEHVGKATPEEGTLLLLEARIHAARSPFPEARENALAAIAAYRRWKDHRVSTAINFLNLLDARRQSGVR